MQKIVWGVALALALGGGANAGELPFAKERIEWNKPQKPFHITGNIFYVGMAGVSAFLIWTPQGDILTDGALPESASAIENNIKALGFRLSDVKILLNSHAHFDHSGGLAQLKRDTGARLYAGAADVPFLESGHIPFGPSSQIDTRPVHVDHPVKDGDVVSLGGVVLTAHATPGHTPGCTTWTMTVLYPRMPPGHVSALFFCSISVAGNPLIGNTSYPRIVSDYRASFAKLKTMHPDVFLAPHGAQFALADKLARRAAQRDVPDAPDPFINAREFPKFLAQAEKDFDAELARQKAGGKP